MNIPQHVTCMRIKYQHCMRSDLWLGVVGTQRCGKPVCCPPWPHLQQQPPLLQRRAPSAAPRAHVHSEHLRAKVRVGNHLRLGLRVGGQ